MVSSTEIVRRRARNSRKVKSRNVVIRRNDISGLLAYLGDKKFWQKVELLLGGDDPEDAKPERQDHKA